MGQVCSNGRTPPDGIYIVAGVAAATDGEEETPVSYESTLWAQNAMSAATVFFNS